MSRPAAVMVVSDWLERRSELAFVARSIAGAATRCGPVAVLVPQGPGRVAADGAFDLQGLGPPGALRWPADVPTDVPIMVDVVTPDVAGLLGRIAPRDVLFLSAGDNAPSHAWRKIPLVGGERPVGVHVPVNRLAERARHHGFGFTDYLLVLGDGTGHHELPPAAAWLSGAFHDADVVVVDDGIAAAWKGRALRGKVSVDTRMDLWRLLAHANACIDLAPGPHIARECIEAMLFGTPIVVPDRSGAAAAHARASGGATFNDESELLDAVARLRSEATRSEAAVRARRYAQEHYGNPDALVRRVSHLLGSQGPVP